MESLKQNVNEKWEIAVYLVVTITTNRPLSLRALFVPLEEHGTKTQTFCVNVSIFVSVIKVHNGL